MAGRGNTQPRPRDPGSSSLLRKAGPCYLKPHREEDRIAVKASERSTWFDRPSVTDLRRSTMAGLPRPWSFPTKTLIRAWYSSHRSGLPRPRSFPTKTLTRAWRGLDLHSFSLDL